MVTPVFCCGAECGQIAAVGAGAGQHWIGTLVAPTISTTTVRTGLRSVRVNPTAQICAATFALGVTLGTTVVLRAYVNFASLPTSDAPIIYLPGGTTQVGVYFKQSDSKLYAGSNNTTPAFGASGVTVTTGVWYRIDLKIDATANPNLIDVQVDGVACGQASVAQGSFTGVNPAFGSTAAQTSDMFIDDVIISVTGADYPIGPGAVESIIPNADGTHTFTTTIGVRGTTAAPTGGGNIAGSTDSWNWISHRPIGGGTGDTTRLWNQQSNGSTLYGEVAFESRPSGVQPPRAVEALCIQQDASTGVGDSTFKLNDGGTEATIFATGAVAGIASDAYHTKQFATAPSTGAAWTLAKYNAIRFRFGYSADANPDHYCRGVMIEAEFPPEVIPRTLISRQAVKRAAYV
jgi:hypothetical protein